MIARPRKGFVVFFFFVSLDILHHKKTTNMKKFCLLLLSIMAPSIFFAQSFKKVI